MDAYLPFRSDLASDPADQSYLRVIGRLRSSVTIPQAQQEMDMIATQIRASYSTFADPPLTLQVVPLQGDVVRNIRPALLALFGGAGLVLLIACVNVANLLLVRANERTLEMALRTAMGAERGRLIRQLLTESVLLSCCGAVAAIGLGWWALRLILAMQPKEMERFSAIQMDPVVFALTFALAIATGLAFGLVPAFGTGKVDLVRTLKETRQAGTRSGQRQRNLQRQLAIYSQRMHCPGVDSLRSLARVVSNGNRERRIEPRTIELSNENKPQGPGEENHVRKILDLPGVGYSLQLNRTFSLGHI
jgi:hypothetical protein